MSLTKTLVIRGRSASAWRGLGRFRCTCSSLHPHGRSSSSLPLQPLRLFLYLSLTPAQLACAGTFVAAVALALGLTLLHVRAHGILAWLPAGVRTLLLETTILEFSLDDSFVGAAKKFVPLFAGPTVGELRELLASYSPRAQRILLQPGGLGKLFPASLQKWLHPSLALEEDDVVAELTALSECREEELLVRMRCRAIGQQ